MERKTQVHAEDGKQELTITRDFSIPLHLLFKAYEDPAIVAQWMGTRVLRLENVPLGGYEFETTDPMGNKHLFTGTIHEFVRDEKITRTFQMVKTPFPVQLEFLTFEKLDDQRSRLNMHVVYKSVAVRDQILQLPFAKGVNWAHNTLEELMTKYKD